MKLSICMMVKNEEKNLEKSLKSLKTLLDKVKSELIIVDTGSTDRTVEIAKKYTENLYFHEWNNNFSEMRNITIDYAKGEWILIIDGDEELESEKSIVEFLNDEKISGKSNSASMYVRNFMSSDRGNYGDIVSIRLYKNDGDFRYEGSVHNIPKFKEPTVFIDATILHYGYISDDVELMDKKFKRTVKLLKKELEKNPEHVYYRYQLSVSYGMKNKWDEAKAEAEKSYKIIKNLSKKDKEGFFYVYSQYILSLRRDKDYDSVIKIAKEALDIRPEDIDIDFFIGEAYSMKGLKDEAIAHYLKNLRMIKKYENKEVLLSTDIKLYSVAFKHKTLCRLLFIMSDIKKYKDVIDLFYEFKDDTFKDAGMEKKIIEIVLNSFLELEEMTEIYKIYSESDTDARESIIEYLEDKFIFFEKANKEKFCSLFARGNDKYSIFNSYRKKTVEKGIENFLNSSGEFKHYYMDIISPYFFEKNDFKAFTNILANFNYDELEKSLKRIKHIEKEDFKVWIFNGIANIGDESLNERYIKNRLKKMFLLNDFGILDEAEKKKLFKEYISGGYEYIRRVYKNSIIEDEELNLEIADPEHRFIIYMKEAFAFEDRKSIAFMKKALKVCPYMGEYIEGLMADIQEKYLGN